MLFPKSKHTPIFGLFSERSSAASSALRWSLWFSRPTTIGWASMTGFMVWSCATHLACQAVHSSRVLKLSYRRPYSSAMRTCVTPSAVAVLTMSAYASGDSRQDAGTESSSLRWSRSARAFNAASASGSCDSICDQSIWPPCAPKRTQRSSSADAGSAAAVDFRMSRPCSIRTANDVYARHMPDPSPSARILEASAASGTLARNARRDSVTTAPPAQSHAVLDPTAHGKRA